jgi:hypothetical protein
MTDDTKDTLIVAGIGLLAVGFLVFHNTLVPAKVAPINLVPAGTQAATSSNSAAVGVAGAQSQTDIATANAAAQIAAANAAVQIANIQAQQQNNNAAAGQTAALYGAAGDALSNIVGTLAGGNDY